jgi:hypothetical protein
MNFRKRLLFLAMLGLSVLSVTRTQDIVIEPPTIRLQATNNSFPTAVGVTITGGTNQFSLEGSENLTDWHTVWDVVTKVRAFWLIDRFSPAGLGTFRFYRALSPGKSSAEMRQNWMDAGLTNYQFRFRRTCSCTPTILSGTVTVRAGKVVAVSDARGAGGEIIPDPDLAAFKSIEDLFDIIRTQSTNADLLSVKYDELRHFPLRVDIDYVMRAVDDEITYEVSAVQPVQ